ncbi:MAG: ABC transporter substrate-binding protein [Propylenella sp.]
MVLRTAFGLATLLLVGAAAFDNASAQTAAMVEPPSLEAAVAAGKLPPVAERIPEKPAIVSFEGDAAPGRYGGTLRLIGGSAKDTRLMVIYGYARLVGYNTDYEIVPDIAESLEVEDDRVFTFHLRPGHKWSDGEPFTSEDFRFYWEDMGNDATVSRFGPPKELLVDGEKPTVDFPDEVTVRYSWSKPNPYFLPALAAAQPVEIFRPAHYLKQFHARHVGQETVDKMAADAGERNWVSLLYSKDRSYRNDNIEYPTLQPWVLKTQPPSDRYVFDRNPYFHRVDQNGLQLPYIDQVALIVSSSDLIPAKVASGEADLQGAYLAFSNFTFLKEAEERSKFKVRRWLATKGARMALYPNLNLADPVLKKLFREADFRRALSVAIDRDDINNTIFYGVASPSNNTVLPDSPLFKDEYRTKWTEYDPELADELLDDLGLAERNAEGIRLMPNGQPLQIVVETAGEETEQIDVLQLIKDHWQDVGVSLFIKPSQREVFYNRINAGETQMAVWTGLENAMLKPTMSPAEFAPLTPDQFQWPAWGLWAQTSGQMGEKPDLEPVEQLMALNEKWGAAETPEAHEAVWHEILSLWTDQVFTIGIVSGVEQLVVVSDRLKNVPQHGIYNFEPGSYFGMYRPDTFWIGEG